MKILTVLLVFCSFSLLAENKKNYQPHMTQYVVDKKVLGKDKFFLIDVGASRGIAKFWRSFGPYLCGVGFEPLTSECERLNSINEFPGVKYVSSFVVSEIAEIDQFDNFNYNPAARASSFSYRKNYNVNYTKLSFNNGAEIKYTDNKISLDRFCKENKIEKVDFIKIDTDGGDFAVLAGAKQLLQNGDVLGLLVESQFHGTIHPVSNTFRNIDTLLVQNGFSLFDLTSRRYTKAELPGKFISKKPAQTTSGQICWADALYLKDFVYMKSQGIEVPSSQIIKMACLFEIFGLPDCAAELLLAYKTQLSPVMDIETCLNALARDMGLYPDYKTHMKRFLTDKDAFFPK